MGFAGNLRTFPLAEVVQTIGRIQGTGVLHLVAEDTSRQVVFREGQILGVSLPAGAERQALLQRMVMQGVIGGEEAAAISQGGSPSQVITALVESQLVTREEVDEAARLQAEEELHLIFTWEAADFTFRDASAEEPEVLALVERFAGWNLNINSNSVLMEAARRADEFARLREQIPDPAAVPGPVDGKEAELAAAGEGFPAAAVVPLVDAVRSVDDICASAVVTRLDVYAVLAELLEAGVVCWLTRDDLIVHGDWLAGQGDHRRAAHLLRKALAADPLDHATRTRLANCLEHLGDGVEASASYDQIARALLEEGDVATATEHARRAVELADSDTRPRMTLVRCLVQGGDNEGAVAVLREVVELHVAAGKLEDARSACLQILEFSPGDEEARRELARIFSRVEHDQQSEDVVVCVSCGHVNHREATACAKCQAALQLACLSCGRVVGVSDRLCIFCGVDPHGGGQRRPGGAPSTSRVIRRGSGMNRVTADVIAAEVKARADSGSSSGPRTAITEGGGAAPPPADWRERLEALLGEAQALEEAGDLDRALAAWRQVASLQPDNGRLLSHLKLLESKSHEVAIEKQIETGHRLRRARHCFAAVRCYRQALRLLPSQDPRVKPVQDALARAERDRLRITGIYGAAVVVLLLLGWFAMYPFWVGWRFQGQVEILRVDIAAVSAPAGLAPVNGDFDRLTQVAASLPGAHGLRARRLLDDANGDLIVAQNRLATIELQRLKDAIARRDAVGAQAICDLYLASFRAGTMIDQYRTQTEALARLKRELRLSDDEAKTAPARLEAARKLEEERRLAEALAAFRALTASSHAESAIAAKEGVARLEPRERSFAADWDSALRIAGSDLGKSEEVLGALLADARAWGRDADLKRVRDEAVNRLELAARAWNALGDAPRPEAVESFIAAHPGVPQLAQARVRLDAARQRLSQRDQALAAYRAHLGAKRWEQAHQAGRDLLSGYAAWLPADAVQLPLVVESQPAGASVQFEGRVLGTTPLVAHFPPGQTGELRLELAGWEPATVRMQDAQASWRSEVVLARRPVWRTALGRPVTALLTTPAGGVLAVTSDSLVSAGADGRVRWRHGLGGDDLGGGRVRSGSLPALLPDGRVAVALPGKDVTVLDANGNPVARLATPGEVRGRPLAYVNEVFGPQARVAVAGDVLSCATPGGEVKRISLRRPAVAGPVSFPRGLDRVLVVATVDGTLVGIEESTPKEVWSLNVQAADCGQLVAAGEQGLVAVLDGSRVACWRITNDGAVPAWSQPLGAPAVGDPVLQGQMVLVSSGREVRRFGLDGTVLASWNLGAAVGSPPATGGDLVAVGAMDGMLHVFKGEAMAWSSQCGKPVTAVAVLPGLVVAGLADGGLIAFKP